MDFFEIVAKLSMLGTHKAAFFRMFDYSEIFLFMQLTVEKSLQMRKARLLLLGAGESGKSTVSKECDRLSSLCPI